MARRRKDDIRERLTARIAPKLTPSDRLAVEMAAAEIGLTPSDFARQWVLNGVRSVEASRAQRKTERDSDAQLTAALVKIGVHLNTLAKLANETQEIESERAVEAASNLLVATVARIEPLAKDQPESPERKALLVELARIGNNTVQLNRIARLTQRRASMAALERVETQIVRSLHLATPA